MPTRYIPYCMQHTVTATALALAVCAVLPVQAVEPDSSGLLGRWKLTKVLDSSEISSIDDKEADRLVGESLVIQPDKISLAGETCEDPEFERHYENATTYLREDAHAPADRLGLPEVVTVVELACKEALLKGDNKIVIYWRGFFFDAVKQPKAEPTHPAEH